MFDAKIADFAVHVLLQSTVLISIGLLAVRVCGRQKPAVQSAILRVTLIAVLLCPFASLTLSNIGITSYALLPAWETPQIAGSANVSTPRTATSLPAEDLPSVINESTALPHAGQSQMLPSQIASSTFQNRNDSNFTNSSPAVTHSESNTVPANRFKTFAGWILSMTWMMGAIVLLMKLLLANREMIRVCRDSQPADAELQRLCRETSETLGLNSPEVKISASVHSPCLVGFWKPVILLPAQNRLTEPVLRDIFLHELAHLARRDCLFHLLARIATAILFFQPLVWRLSRRLEFIADDLCDDYVIQYGSGRKSYANTLVDFAEQLPALPLATEAGLAMVSLRSSLSRRIMRIMDSSRSLTLRLPARWVALIAVLGITATASAALIVNARSTSIVKNETKKEAIQPDQGRTVAATLEFVPQTSPVNTATKTVPNADTKQKTEVSTKSELQFQGRVVDPNGIPVKQATINYTNWDMPNKRILATTNEQGTFSFTIAPSDQLYKVLQKGGTFVALADGFGPAMKAAYDCETSGKLRKALLERNSNSHAPATMLEQLRKRILGGKSTFQLVADDLPLTGRIVNIDGQPVAGAKLQVAKLIGGVDERLDGWEQAAQTTGTDYYRLQQYLGMRLGSDVGGPTLDYMPTTMTDKNGEFIFKGLGRDRIVKLLISGPEIETSNVYARTRKGEMIEVPMEKRNPSLRKITYHPNSFTFVAGPSQPVEGIVRDSKTQKPMPGVTLQSYHLAGHRMSGWTEGIVHTISDKEGRYRLEGLPIGKNEVICLSPLDQPYLISKFVAETEAGGTPLQKNIELTRGIWVEGRAYDKDTDEPIEGGRVEYFAFSDNPFRKSIKIPLGHHSRRYLLQPDGTYRIPVLPGRGIVTMMADDHMKYQRGSGAEKIKGRYNHTYAFPTVPYMLAAMNFHVLAEVNPAEDAKSIQLDFPFEVGRSLKVKVVDQNGKPVQGGQYVGLMDAFHTWQSFNRDELEIRGYRNEKPRRVQVFHEGSKQVGYLFIQGKNPTNLVIRLEPWAEITGRFVDVSGVPKARAQIGNVYESMLDNPEIVSLPPNIRKQTGNMLGFDTDEEGRFTIIGLLPGKKHRISASETRKNGNGYYLGDFEISPPLKPGEVRDLGDIQFKQKGAE
ncbi:M56 family metallopeptidase [Gimesia fumaroli]|uniref:Regulatory protein BlaR1 n=1 Tax=Gimesia fumaroli TaxID=2527976 RepID=A0A518IFC8_9PLAN|nr:M56 family metallopeptidase [Gimesia fumaroli]QDV51796.1 Regulatory protein BlaR1 [Gimesia fumaroli]